MATLDPKQLELLSAYLDGEANEAEQATVERLIAERAEAKRLLAELNALRESVRALPAVSPEKGFLSEVLRRVESRSAGEGQAPVSDDESGSLDWRRLVARVFGPRSLAYAGVTVAVALLLMFMTPSVQQRRTALQRDGTARTRSVAKDEKRGDIPTMGALPADDRELKAEAESAECFAEVPPAPTAPAEEAPAAASPAPASAPSMAPSPADEEAVRLAIPREPSRFGGVRGPSGGPSERPDGGLAPSLGRLEDESMKGAARHKSRGMELNEVEVVRVGVTQDAIDRGTLQQLLVSNNIEVQEAPEVVEELRTAAANNRALRQSAMKVEKQDDTEANEIVVLIEAHPEDLEAFLFEVSSQADLFPRARNLGFDAAMGMGMAKGEGTEVGAMGGGMGQMGPQSGEGMTSREQMVPGASGYAGKPKGAAVDRLAAGAASNALSRGRGQAVILTEADSVDSVEVAQSQMQSNQLFRRGNLARSENATEDKPVVGRTIEESRAGDAMMPVQQAIVVFEIVPPQPEADSRPAAEAAEPGKP